MNKPPPATDLAQLLAALRGARDPWSRLKLVATGARELAKLTPGQRVQLLRQLGLEGAEELTETAVGGDVQTTAAVMQALRALESDPQRLRQLASAIADPGSRRATLTGLAAHVLESVTAPPPPVKGVRPGARAGALPVTPPGTRPAAPPQPVTPTPPQQVTPPPPQAPPPATPQPSPPETPRPPQPPAPSPSQPPPAPAPPTAPEPVVPPVPHPLPGIPGTAAESGAVPALEGAGAPPAPAISPAASPAPALSSEPVGLPSSRPIEALRALRRRLAAGEAPAAGSMETLLAHQLPHDWARRRALAALFAQRLPADLDEALALLGQVESAAARRWALADLAASRPWEEADWERLLAAADSPSLRRRLAARRRPA